MPDSPRLLLHVGMSKTGSSALQVAFVQHRELLERHGLTYPADPSDVSAAQGGITSGNGIRLARYLVPGLARADADLDTVLDRALGPVRRGSGGDLLLSSEFLWHFDPERLATAVDRCRELGYTVAAVGYVRDVAGHALSEYSQQVKRHRFTASFADFAAGTTEPGYEPGMRQWISGLQSVVGPDQVAVHHYDTHRRRLVAHFFAEALDIHDELPLSVSTVVNRSLTPAELTLMRAVNGRIGSPLAGTFASDALISLPPLGDPTVRLSQGDLAVLVDRFSDEVDWINRHALTEPVLDIRGAVEVGEDAVPESNGDDRETLLAMAASLADRAAELQRQLKQAGRA